MASHPEPVPRFPRREWEEPSGGGLSRVAMEPSKVVLNMFLSGVMCGSYMCFGPK